MLTTVIVIFGTILAVVGVSFAIWSFIDTHRRLGMNRSNFGDYLLARFYLNCLKRQMSQDEMDAFFFSQSRYNFRQEGDIYEVVDQHRWNKVVETYDTKDEARCRAAELNLELELGEDFSKTTDEVN